MTRVHDEFSKVAGERGDAAAIISAQGTLSYAQLDAWSNGIASAIADIEPEEIVGVYANRSPEYVAAIIAILKAGGAYLSLDPSAPAARLRQLAEKSGLRTVLVSRSVFDAEQPLFQDEVKHLVLEDLPRNGANLPPKEGQLAYLMYTSGSTGGPKGVEIKHEGLVRVARNRSFDITSDDIFAQLAPLHADPSGFEIWAPLLNGALLTIPRPGELSIRDIAQHILQHRVSVLRLVAPLFAAFVDSRCDAMGGLRLALSGGDRASPTAFRTLLETHPHCTAVNAYGPTETTIMACCHFTRSTDHMDEAVPIGHPLDGFEALILDNTDNQAETGELCLAGPGLARGYKDQDALTQSRFFMRNGQRYYRTGDRVRRLHDGSLLFLGRRDRQIKVRGFRVEPEEIETSIATIEGVAEVAVVGRNEQLIAFVQFHSKPRPIDANLRQILPAYCVPSLIVPVEAFPLLPNGKIDRRALEAHPLREHPDIGDMTETEKLLSQIWSDALGGELIGRDSNFFEFGGNSLSSMKIVAKLEDLFGLSLPMTTLFDAPTVKEFASLVTSSGISRAPLAKSADRRAPLSAAQLGILYDERRSTATNQYLISRTLHVKGEFYPDIFVRALDALVDRQEALRVNVVPTETGADMIACGKQIVRPQRIDLRCEPATDRRRLAETSVGSFSRKPLDLQHEPPLRVLLVELSANEHIVHFDLHHIISDDWSLDVLWRELEALYQAERQGWTPHLPELPANYLDYAQDNSLVAASGQGALADAWAALLQDYRGPIDFIYDQVRPQTPSGEGATHWFELSHSEFKLISDCCRRHKLSHFMFVLSGVYAVLSRYSGQNDICIATPVAGRDRAGVQSLIGYFVNMLPVRLRTGLGQNVTDLMQAARRSCLDSFSLKNPPIQKAGDERSAGMAGTDIANLFQIALSYQQTPPQTLRLEDAEIADISETRPQAKFELGFAFEENASGLSCAIEYSTDLFSSASVSKLAEHMRNALIWMARNSSKPLADLDFSDEHEKHLISHLWVRNDTPIDVSKPIHELVKEQVKQHPLKIAVRDQMDAKTYAELDELSTRIAVRLLEEGTQVEDPVAVCLERSPLLIASMLGVLKAGGVYVPLDPTYPETRLSLAMDDAKPIATLTTEDIRRRLFSRQKGSFVILDRETLPPPRPVDVRVLPENLAYIIYTSGSTGKPKGVSIEHRSAVNMLKGHRALCGFTADDVWSQFAAAGFDMAIYEQLQPLLTGATSIICPDDVKLGGEAYIDFINDNKISVQVTTPTLLRSLDQPEFPTVRHILTGGEAAIPLDVSHYSKTKTYLNCYGPTETTICATSYVGQTEELMARVPVGKPLVNNEVYILDAYNRPCPIGVPGEIFIGGRGLARGYYGDEVLTQQKFVHIPGIGSERLYKSGDRARWLPDGNVDFLGRLNEQVKVRGFRVELGDIESVISNCPQVTQFAAIVRNQRLIGFFSGQTPSDAIKAFASERLPKYMVPDELIQLGQLPMTEHNKVDRRKLAELATTVKPSSSHAPPANATEKAVCALWTDLLKVHDVGRDDDFFEIGGHSLLTVRLLDAIERQFSHRISIRDFLNAPTVKDLAAAISGELPDIDYVRAEQFTVPHAFNANAHPQKRPLSTQSILLTGATGLLGTHLLCALLNETSADVHCLTRASSKDAAMERLRKEFERYDLDGSLLEKRVTALPGDLSQPGLGLTQTEWAALRQHVDLIINSGAYVHHSSPFSRLRSANVEGVKTLLELSAESGAPFKQISTLAVFNLSSARTISDTLDIGQEKHPPGRGYSASKWVADQLVLDAARQGLDCQIIRLGRILGSAATGAGNPDDMFYRLLLTCAELAAFPVERSLDTNFLPADFTARSIVRLALSSTSGVHHLHHRDATSIETFMTHLAKHEQRSFKPLSLGEWLALWPDRDLPGTPYRPMLAEMAIDAPPLPLLDNTRTLERLEGLGLPLPIINEELILKYWKKLRPFVAVR